MNEPRTTSYGLHSSYKSDGYVALARFLDDEELGELESRLDRFMLDVVPAMPDDHVFYEDKQDTTTLKQLQHMCDYDPWFHKLITVGKFRALAEELLQSPVVPKNLQYFNKPPRIGRPTPPHQDGFYFKLNPCLALTMWLALDVVNEENGCVRYIPGSHKLGMRAHTRSQMLGFSQTIADFPVDTELEIEVSMSAQPGDLLAHDALTIHRAGGNESVTRSRRSLGFIYYSEDATEDAASHQKYQQELANELRSKGKI